MVNVSSFINKRTCIWIANLGTCTKVAFSNLEIFLIVTRFFFQIFSLLLISYKKNRVSPECVFYGSITIISFCFIKIWSHIEELENRIYWSSLWILHFTSCNRSCTWNVFNKPVKWCFFQTKFISVKLYTILKGLFFLRNSRTQFLVILQSTVSRRAKKQELSNFPTNEASYGLGKPQHFTAEGLLWLPNQLTIQNEHF